MINIQNDLIDLILKKMIDKEQYELLIIKNKLNSYHYFNVIDGIFIICYNAQLTNITSFTTCSLISRCFESLPDINNPIYIPIYTLACILIASKLDEPTERACNIIQLIDVTRKFMISYKLWNDTFKYIQIESTKVNTSADTYFKLQIEFCEYNIVKLLKFNLIYITPMIYIDYYILNIFDIYPIYDHTKFITLAIYYISSLCYIPNYKNIYGILDPPTPSLQIVIILSLVLEEYNLDYNLILEKLKKYYDYSKHNINLYITLYKSILNDVIEFREEMLSNIPIIDRNKNILCY